LVKHYNLGISGVAWGTVIAQYAGLLTALLFLFKYKKKLVKIEWQSIFHINEFLQFFKVNGDIFIRTICLTLAFAFFYSQSAKHGVNSLAVMILLLQFLNWMSYFIDGFAFAAESLVGRYYGAKNNALLFKSIKYILYWGFFLSLIIALIYGWFGIDILRLFTDDIIIIQEAQSLMIWTIIMPLAGFLSYIWDGVFIGLTAVKAMRNSMIISFSAYILLFYAVPLDSLDWYWISFLIFLFLRGVVQTIQYYLYIKPRIIPSKQ